MAAPSSSAPINSERAAAHLAQLDAQLDHMRRKFNMYFNGIDRTPPLIEYENLKRAFRELQGMQFNTGQSRFKSQNLVARWQLQRSLWERDLARKEEGLLRPMSHVPLVGRKETDALDDG